MTSGFFVLRDRTRPAKSPTPMPVSSTATSRPPSIRNDFTFSWCPGSAIIVMPSGNSTTSNQPWLVIRAFLLLKVLPVNTQLVAELQVAYQFKTCDQPHQLAVAQHRHLMQIIRAHHAQDISHRGGLGHCLQV